MALGCSFGVMTIPLAKPLITIGAVLQPISAGATTSAERQKKAWGSAGRGLVTGGVAMGVAFSDNSSVLTTAAGWAMMGGSHPHHQMSEEQLKAFLAAVKADTGLQEKLKAATEPDAVVAIAKAAGFVISAEELKRAQAEVSEEELEGVAGGGPVEVWAGTVRINEPDFN